MVYNFWELLETWLDQDWEFSLTRSISSRCFCFCCCWSGSDCSVLLRRFSCSSYRLLDYFLNLKPSGLNWISCISLVSGGACFRKSSAYSFLMFSFIWMLQQSLGGLDLMISMLLFFLIAAAYRLSSEQVRLQPSASCCGTSSSLNFSQRSEGLILPGAREVVLSFPLLYFTYRLMSSETPYSELLEEDCSAFSLACLVIPNSLRQQGSKLSSMTLRVFPLTPVELLADCPPMLGTMSIIQYPSSSFSMLFSYSLVQRMCVWFLRGEQQMPWPQKTPPIISPWQISPFQKSIRPQCSSVPSKKLPQQSSLLVQMSPSPLGLLSSSTKPMQLEVTLFQICSMQSNITNLSRLMTYLLISCSSSSDLMKEGGSMSCPFSTWSMVSSLPSQLHLAEIHSFQLSSQVIFSPSRWFSQKRMHFTSRSLQTAIVQPLNLPSIKWAMILQPREVKISARPSSRSCCHVPKMIVPFFSIMMPSPCFWWCRMKPWYRKPSVLIISKVGVVFSQETYCLALCFCEYLVLSADLDLLICWQLWLGLGLARWVDLSWNRLNIIIIIKPTRNTCEYFFLCSSNSSQECLCLR